MVYSQEVAKHDLLSREQEAHLAQEIARGREAARQLEAGGLPAAQQAELSRMVERGHRARDALVEGNLRLVVKLAFDFSRRLHAQSAVLPQVPVVDLIQVGNIGLFAAAQKFDHRKNVSFSTYAWQWITGALWRAISEERVQMGLPPLNRERRSEKQEEADDRV